MEWHAKIIGCLLCSLDYSLTEFLAVRPLTRALMSPDYDTTFSFTLGSHTPILLAFIS